MLPTRERAGRVKGAERRSGPLSLGFDERNRLGFGHAASAARRLAI
jgi:hypothetical protein